MTATIKSVLFIDYDSLYLSLRARDPGMARRFASRPGVWLEAIEAGLLIEPRTDPPTKRRVLMRRCYADPKLLGKARSAFATHGFQIVDCPPLVGRERNSAEAHMVLDTIDALAHQTGFEEFILLSADCDLTPVIFRLRSYNRATSIYSTPATATGYRAIAEGVLEEKALIALLAPTADAETPEAPDEAEDDANIPANDLAGLARRVNQATNVPLFSPKAYGELFRMMVREVSEHGYHFQATAENVAARLVANGRNVSRRQIAFVIKGLALKGHVFSANDTPEKLAEVFKEQVLYLARSAGVEIDDGTEEQIRAWIVGRQAFEPPPPVVKPMERSRLTPIPSPPPMPVLGAPLPREMKPISLQSFSGNSIPQPIRPIAVRPAMPPALTAATPIEAVVPPPPPPPPLPPVAVQRPPEPEPEPLLEAIEDEPEPEQAVAEIEEVIEAPPPIIVPPPPRTPRIQAAQPVVLPEPAPAPPPPAPPAPAARQVAEPSAEPQTPPPRGAIAPPRPRVRPANPEPAAEPPRSVTIRPTPARPASPTPLRPPARRAIGGSRGAAEESDKDPVESSILAAIAEAVDVLVDDEGEQDQAPPARPKRAPAPEARETRPEPEPEDDDGDIGDEIQRILAAYSQNRKPTGR